MPVGDLSGGEQARVRIAQLMLQPADLLLLDEPTNDLDIPALEVLEDSLAEFPGALVLVSHDRELMDRLCTEVVGLDGRGGAGGVRQRRPVAGGLRARGRGPPAKAARPTAAAGRPGRRPKPRKLSYSEQQEWDGMEAAILAAEEAVGGVRGRGRAGGDGRARRPGGRLPGAGGGAARRRAALRPLAGAGGQARAVTAAAAYRFGRRDSETGLACRLCGLGPWPFFADRFAPDLGSALATVPVRARPAAVFFAAPVVRGVVAALMTPRASPTGSTTYVPAASVTAPAAALRVFPTFAIVPVFLAIASLLGCTDRLYAPRPVSANSARARHDGFSCA